MFDDFLDWQDQRYLRASGAALAASTRDSKLRRLRGILRTLSLPSERSLATHISERASVVSMIDTLYARNAPATVRLQLVALTQFGEWAVAKGWIASHAVDPGDKPGGIRQKPITVWTPEQVELILMVARARDLRHWMFLTTIADTGRRVGEVLNLRWDDLNLTADVPHWNIAQAKNGRQSYVPIGRRVREEVFTPANIERLKRKGNPTLKRSIAAYPFPYTYESASQRLKVVLDIANVPYAGHHRFRHSRITQWLTEGKPLHAVSLLAGHANTSVTDRLYFHASALDMARYID